METHALTALYPQLFMWEVTFYNLMPVRVRATGVGEAIQEARRSSRPYLDALFIGVSCVEEEDPLP